MPIVSENVPSGEGPSASLPFGGGTQIAAEQHALASQAGSSTPQPGQAPQPQQPQQAPPQAPPPTQPDAPPTQPNGRLDMQQVFPPMPEMKPTVPLRDYLRTMAAHPSAGPNLARAAAMIEGQRGPLH